MIAAVAPRIAPLIVLCAAVACAQAAQSGSAIRPQQEGPVEDSVHEVVYTLGVWRVRAGQEAEFVAAWKALGEAFARLPHPPGTGTLIRSVSEPGLFYSFGPWRRLEDIREMRGDPRAQAAIQRLVALCAEATPGTFRLVAEAPAGSTELH